MLPSDIHPQFTIETSGLVDSTDLASPVQRTSLRKSQPYKVYRVKWVCGVTKVRELREHFYSVGKAAAIGWQAPDESEPKAYRFESFQETCNSIRSFEVEASLVLLAGVKVPY